MRSHADLYAVGSCVDTKVHCISTMPGLQKWLLGCCYWALIKKLFTYLSVGVTMEKIGDIEHCIRF